MLGLLKRVARWMRRRGGGRRPPSPRARPGVAPRPADLDQYTTLMPEALRRLTAGGPSPSHRPADASDHAGREISD